MECKITSTRRRSRAALTFIDMVVGSAIGLLIMAGLLSLMGYTAKTFAAVANYVEMDQKSRMALDKITSQVRQMDTVTAVSNTFINFLHSGTSFSLIYTATNKTLSQVDAGVTTALLDGVTVCRFEAFQRDTTNSFDSLPVATGSNTCKVVRVSWTCTRSIQGVTNETELDQSAEVVIRN